MIVYVVAWRYEGGGGFDWYYEPRDAEKAWVAELKNVEQFRDSGWTAYKFQYSTGIAATRKTITHDQRNLITRNIDDYLDELCDKAEQVAR